MDDIRILVDALLCFLCFETILHCLGAFSEGPLVYLRLVLAVLLSALDVSANIFSQQKIGHFLVYVCSHGWGWNDHVLLLIIGDPDILSIGALAPSILFPE